MTFGKGIVTTSGSENQERLPDPFVCQREDGELKTLKRRRAHPCRTGQIQKTFLYDNHFFVSAFYSPLLSARLAMLSTFLK